MAHAPRILKLPETKSKIQQEAHESTFVNALFIPSSNSFCLERLFLLISFCQISPELGSFFNKGQQTM